MSEQPVEHVGGGYWREDGTFQAPDGWPEGAGWVVRNADGSIDSWGPASDLKLVAGIGFGSPADPGDYHVALKGVPQPAKGDSTDG
jgi:hypothetical protein